MLLRFGGSSSERCMQQSPMSGTASPFSGELIEDVRSQIAKTLPDPEQAMCRPTQPFMLHMLSQSLKLLSDPDYEILDQGSECFAEGVPLGWDEPIGRAPQVFPKRT